MRRCKYGRALSVLLLIGRLLFMELVVQAAPTEAKETSVLTEYEAYYDRLMSIENRDGIADGGFLVVEDQIFPLNPDEEDGLLLVPAFDERYNRLALFLVDGYGQILYRTEQLETNYCVRGRMAAGAVHCGGLLSGSEPGR